MKNYFKGTIIVMLINAICISLVHIFLSEINLTWLMTGAVLEAITIYILWHYFIEKQK